MALLRGKPSTWFDVRQLAVVDVKMLAGHAPAPSHTGWVLVCKAEMFLSKTAFFKKIFF